MNKLEFLAIGDMVTDAFILLKDADEHVSHGQRELCVRFGDKIPYERVDVVPAVGNAPNAAVAAHRLGVASAIATNIGDDEHGKQMLAALKEEGVPITHVAVHRGRESNYHYVLRFNEERTILVKHHGYPYALPELSEPPAFIYLSSLAENSLPFHGAIADYLEEHRGVKLAFQPGTFQIKLGVEKLARIYKSSYLFFCNKEEAQKILKTETDDVKELLAAMHKLGPKIPVITDGPKGAYALDNETVWRIPMYPDPKPPVDRTGAGDSFAATFTVALALGNDVPTALTWGPINAMSVVQHVGAQAGLLTRTELERYVAAAPAGYAPQKRYVFSPAH